MTIQHHYFERDGHRLHYEIETPAGVAADAPLALILPGFWRRAGAPVFMPLTAAFAGRGMRTLRMDGARKVLSGRTTPEEVLRVTQMDTF